jgi:xylulose-5-phosphate/fructose-6-phosphate phosphoketolase
VLPHDLDYYFTPDKPVVINFHGYPQTVKQILFDYNVSADRFTVHGYEESGSTTTVFDMMVRNRVDRYHLVMDALKAAAAQGIITEADCTAKTALFEEKIATHRAFVIEHGDDPEEITNWSWQSRS